jgi:AcrR family transcriptional regulator
VSTQRSRPRAGSREEKAAIRREQVLAAAFELFCEHGYAGTSTRRIAEAAGVTEGLVFHYFGSKEALLLEIAARRHTFAGRVLTFVQRAEHGSARALLIAVADGLAEISAQERAFIAFMLAEAQINPLLRERVSSATDVMIGAFVATLEPHVERGELRAEASLEAAVLGFFGGFLFFFTQHRQLGEPAWRREATAFAQAWADQCWRGLATADAAGKLSDHSAK